MHRLESAQAEVRVKRPHHAADCVLHEAQFLGDFRGSSDQGATNGIAVAADVFGRGVHDDVGAMLERTRQHGRCESIVDHRDRPRRARKPTDCRDIDHFERWIGRRFDPHHFRLVLADRRASLRQVAHVNMNDLVSRAARAHSVEQTVGAAVHIVHAHDRVASVHQLERRCDGGEAGCKGESAASTLRLLGKPRSLEHRNAALEGESRCIVAARILVALVHARRLLDEGRAWCRSVASPRPWSGRDAGRRECNRSRGACGCVTCQSCFRRWLMRSILVISP